MVGFQFGCFRTFGSGGGKAFVRERDSWPFQLQPQIWMVLEDSPGNGVFEWRFVIFELGERKGHEFRNKPMFQIEQVVFPFVSIT